MAKQIIRFIYDLSQAINHDPDLDGKLKVYFMEDYKVSLAEIIIPAAEISQQISQAGKEASGTGNMKLMINGAVTLGTMDGANVEIHEAVGDENIFIFGLRDHQVEELQEKGYHPMEFIEKDEWLRRALDAMEHGFCGVRFENLARQLKEGNDPYMVAADFTDYSKTAAGAMEIYRDQKRWNQMSLVNIANAGRFAADRSIKDYAAYIWEAKPVKRW